MNPAPGTTRRRRVRSIVVRAVVFLLLGAVVNVAVAWGCVLWAPYPKGNNVVRNDGGEWPVQVPPHWPTMSESRATWGNSFLTETLYSHGSGDRLTLSTWLKQEDSGVPLRALRATELSESDDNLEWNVFAPHGKWLRGIDIPRPIRKFSEGRAFTLPIAPVWPGFAVNTLFYAAILWLLFAAPGRVRRWRRIRRGLCAKCAYPVGASDVCTECGASISAKSRARGSMGLPPPATPAPGTTRETNA